MGALLFDGVNDQLKWTTLATALANTSDTAWTMAALFKFSDETHFNAISYLLSGAGAGTAEAGLSYSSSTDGPTIDVDGGKNFGDTVDLTVNTTYLIVVSKGAGTVSPKIAVKPAGGSVTHATSGNTLGDQVAAAQLQIGTWQDGDFFEGWIGVIAFWEGEMSDANKEAIATAWSTSSMWTSAHGQPTFLAELNVAAGSVVDLAGNASTTSHTGTSLDAGETLGDWTFDAQGFPSTSVLDTFSISDISPLPSPWTGPMVVGEGQFQVVGNEARGTDGAAFNSMGRGSYGPDCEAYMKVPTISAGNRIEVYLRSFFDVSGLDGYCVSVVTNTWTLRVVTNSTSSALGANHSGPTISAGDLMGIRAVGPILEAWHKPAAGSWTFLFTRTDSTYTGSGLIGARMFGTTYEFDDFGGGTKGVLEVFSSDPTFKGTPRRGFLGVA